MRYHELNGIEIIDRPGACPVGRDTLLLAQCAADEADARDVLELGLGSGLISVYLSGLGRDVTGADICPACLRTAAENARRNNVDVRLVETDLFRALPARYDLIVFNPPLGSQKTARLAGSVERLKSVLPRNLPVAVRAAYRLSRRSRLPLIERFLDEAPRHLKPRGRVLAFLHDSEAAIARHHGYTCEPLLARPEIRMRVMRLVPAH